MPETSNRLSLGLMSAWTKFMNFVPNLLGAAIILIVGWIIAGFVAKLIERVLVAVGLERALMKTNVHSYLGGAEGSHLSASGVIATLAKWFLRLIFIQEAGLGRPGLFEALSRYAILGFAVIAALNQLGIATMVVNTLMIGLVGSVSLAVGLAFGLGGKDVAGEITRNAYDSSRPAQLASATGEGSLPRSPEALRKVGT